MSQLISVFSALKAYNASLREKQADYLENSQIKINPFFLADEIFPRRQSYVDTLQGGRAVKYLLSLYKQNQKTSAHQPPSLSDSFRKKLSEEFKIFLEALIFETMRLIKNN